MPSFFIKCISPSHQQNVLYVLKNNKPHKLNHPASLDRDWFLTAQQAAKVKRQMEKLYAMWPSLKFVIEPKKEHHHASKS